MNSSRGDLRDIFSLGQDCLASGRPRQAIKLFTAYAKAEGKYRQESDSQLETDDGVMEFLEKRSASLISGKTPLPAYLTEDAEANAGHLERYAGLRFLLLAPEYVHNSQQYIQSEYYDHYGLTLVNSGIPVDTFPTNDISYPALGHDPVKGARGLARLAKFVMDSKPDVLLVDTNFMGAPTTVNREFILALRRRTGVKVVGIIGDGWGGAGARLAEYWGDACDTMLYGLPGSPFVAKSRHRDKLLLIPWPVDAGLFAPPPEKSRKLFFSGQLASGYRAMWMSFVLDLVQRHGLSAYLLTHRRTAEECPPFAEYAALLSGSLMTLNFSARGGGEHAITGRSYCAFWGASLLLEEYNPMLEHFFVPYVHYAPFSTVRQLERFILFFASQPEKAKALADAGRAFCVRHYSPDHIWSRVLDHAFKGPRRRQGSHP